MQHQITPIVEAATYPGKAVAGPNNVEPSLDKIDAKGLSLVELSGVSVVGAGYIRDNDTGSFVYEISGHPLFPGWVDPFTQQGLSYISGRSEKTLDLLARANDLEPVKVGACYTFTHFNFVYGHFLLEMLPKLFAIRERYRQGHIHPIIVPRAVRPWVIPHLLSVFPEALLLSFDDSRQRIAPERLIGVAGDLFVQNPWFTRKCREFAGNSAGSRKIYVARPEKHETNRIFANHKEIEALAVARGFEVVEPSKLTLQAQAKLFSEAAIVVGEFTSAFHNTMFSPPGTVTIAINRVATIQWRIANACGHYLDYVTPDEGYVEWGPEPIEFHVSPENFITALDAALGCEGGKRGRLPSTTASGL